MQMDLCVARECLVSTYMDLGEIDMTCEMSTKPHAVTLIDQPHRTHGCEPADPTQFGAYLHLVSGTKYIGIL